MKDDIHVLLLMLYMDIEVLVLIKYAPVCIYYDYHTTVCLLGCQQIQCRVVVVATMFLRPESLLNCCCFCCTSSTEGMYRIIRPAVGEASRYLIHHFL